MVQVDIRRHIFIINADWEEMIASGDGTALEKSFLVDNLCRPEAVFKSVDQNNVANFRSPFSPLMFFLGC